MYLKRKTFQVRHFKFKAHVVQKVKCRLWVEQTWEHDPYYVEFISVLEAHFKLKLTGGSYCTTRKWKANL